MLLALACLMNSSTALAYEDGYRVALLGAAPDPSYNIDVRDWLMITDRGLGPHHTFNGPRSAYGIRRIDVFDASSGTPTSTFLADYDAVLVYAHGGVPFDDPVALGDLLAEAVDQGIGVTLAGEALIEGTGPTGRFTGDDLAPSDYGPQLNSGALQLFPNDPADAWDVGPQVGGAVFWDVNLGLIPGNFAGALTAQGGGVAAGGFTNGAPAVILRQDTPARTAAVNVPPPSEVVDPNGWVIGTDIPRLVANTVLWTAGFERRFGVCAVPQDDGTYVAQFPADFANPRTYQDPSLPIRCNDVSECRPEQNVECFVFENTDILQDLNCNGIDVGDEVTVDVSSSECENNDPDPGTGLPYDNADYYWNYSSFECEFFGPDYDPDQDLLSGGSVEVFEDGDPNPVLTHTLQCDNCPDRFNPNQYNTDWISAVATAEDAAYDDGDINAGMMAVGGDTTGDACDPVPYAHTSLGKFDTDYDGIADMVDNCVVVPNTDQYDDDQDGNGNVCDNCRGLHNPVQMVNPLYFLYPGFQEFQADAEGDGVGDACDNCLDHPKYPEWFPTADPPVRDLANPDQYDRDGDGWGDACDTCPDMPDPMQLDDDNDRVGNACDNCPDFASPDNTDQDQDGLGDPCDNCDLVVNLDQQDLDEDGLGDACDNCPFFGNEDQADFDGDGVGDFCDICPEDFDPEQLDSDGDELGDACDNCPNVFQTDFVDRDGDGLGDACDFCPFDQDPENADRDGDQVGDLCDNCPDDPNPLQTDTDGDQAGDACDKVALRGGGRVSDGCSTAPAGSLGLLALLGVVGLRRRR